MRAIWRSDKRIAGLKKLLAKRKIQRHTHHCAAPRIEPSLDLFPPPPAPFSLFASNLTKRQYCAEVTVKKSLAAIGRK